MIELYYWPTPNGHKITMLLEEVGLMASYPWVVPWKRQQQDLQAFPSLQRWFNQVRARPATIRAYEKGEPLSNRPTITEEGKKLLFGQTAHNIPSRT